MSAPKFLRTLLLFGLFVALPALAQTGAVAGTVTDPGGNPVSTAVVTLSGVDGPSHSAAAAPDGAFLLQQLPSGTYTVRASAAGFAALEQSGVAVAIGRTTHLTLQLYPRRRAADRQRHRRRQRLRHVAVLLRRQHRP